MRWKLDYTLENNLTFSKSFSVLVLTQLLPPQLPLPLSPTLPLPLLTFGECEKGKMIELCTTYYFIHTLHGIFYLLFVIAVNAEVVFTAGV